jgi:hypothetical protein
MASGLFCVTGPRHFVLGFELGADNGVEGVILGVQVESLLSPLAHCLITAEDISGDPLCRWKFLAEIESV